MPIVANRHWVPLALLAGAVLSYSVGFIAGFAALLATGVLLELAFGFTLFKRRRRPW